MKCCKTCRFLDVPLDKAGRRMVRSNHGYGCLWKLPKNHFVLPDSITQAPSYRLGRLRTFMEGDEGTTCPTWEKRDD